MRVPVLPGFNDDSRTILAIGRFAESLENVHEIHLLAHHMTGVEKYARLGKKYKVTGMLPPSRDYMAGIARELAGLSLSVSIGG